MSWTVADVMTKDVVKVSPSTPFKTCADLLRVHGVSAMPVIVADSRIIGIVSEADLLRKEARLSVRERYERPDRISDSALRAAELMTSDVVTIGPGATLPEAARLMHQRHVKRLPVVDSEGRLVGIVSRSDVLRVFLRSDASIRREVSEDLVGAMPLIGAGSVYVEVRDGVVHLQGEMETGSLTRLLVRLVGGVPGVVGVENHIRLASDVYEGSARKQALVAL
jgi:CBS-domain-containing membrane protein